MRLARCWPLLWIPRQATVTSQNMQRRLPTISLCSDSRNATRRPALALLKNIRPCPPASTRQLGAQAYRPAGQREEDSCAGGRHSAAAHVGSWLHVFRSLGGVSHGLKSGFFVVSAKLSALSSARRDPPTPSKLVPPASRLPGTHPPLSFAELFFSAAIFRPAGSTPYV